MKTLSELFRINKERYTISLRALIFTFKNAYLCV